MSRQWSMVLFGDRTSERRTVGHNSLLQHLRKRCDGGKRLVWLVHERRQANTQGQMKSVVSRHASCACAVREVPDARNSNFFDVTPQTRIATAGIKCLVVLVELLLHCSHAEVFGRRLWKSNLYAARES